jgi:arsenite-transporting ATPase
MNGFLQDMAFAIPGVDEAMGFAEIMKYKPISFALS